MEDYEQRNMAEWDSDYAAQLRENQSNRQKNSFELVSDSESDNTNLFPSQQRMFDHTLRDPHPALRNTTAWLVAEGDTKPEATRRQLQPLLVGGANAAEAAWRSLERPTGSIRVPEELVWRDQQHEIIARRFGTFVFSDDPRGRGGFIKFDIWGTQTAVEDTKQAIYNWTQRESPSKHELGLRTLAKQKSLLPSERKTEEKKWHLEVSRQRFRREPPIGMQFGAIGTFHWPVQDFSPQEMLGNNYEAFDPIRMENSCYVVFNQVKSAFQVMGESAAVKVALLRIRKAHFQISARQIGPVRRYFLDFHKTDGQIPSHVTLETYEHIKCLGPAATTPPGYPGYSPRGQCDTHLNTVQQQQRYEMSTRDCKIAGRSIMLMIAKLHYYRGHLKFRIRLGTFLATQYRTTDDDRYTTNEFSEMMQQSQFAGEVTLELGDRNSENTCLETLRSADFLLGPRDTNIRSLYDIKPTYTAIFTFPDSAGDMCLEMSWQEAQDDSGSNIPELNEPSHVWSRLDRGATSLSSLIDISLLNLKNRSAWHFELSASHAVEKTRLDPRYHDIVKSIRADVHVARQQRADIPFVRFAPYAGVKTLRQLTSYKFLLKNSGYTLELTRFQDRVYTPRIHSNGDPECAVYEPRWSVEVYHSEWDSNLAANERLAVGETVGWSNDVKKWFPEDDNDDLGQVKGERGFEQLIAKLRLVAKQVLRSDI